MVLATDTIIPGTPMHTTDRPITITDGTIHGMNPGMTHGTALGTTHLTTLTTVHHTTTDGTTHGIIRDSIRATTQCTHTPILSGASPQMM